MNRQRGSASGVRWVTSPRGHAAEDRLGSRSNHHQIPGADMALGGRLGYTRCAIFPDRTHKWVSGYKKQRTTGDSGRDGCAWSRLPHWKFPVTYRPKGNLVTRSPLPPAGQTQLRLIAPSTLVPHSPRSAALPPLLLRLLSRPQSLLWGWMEQQDAWPGYTVTLMFNRL